MAASRFDVIANRLVAEVAPRLVERVVAAVAPDLTERVAELVAERYGESPPLLDAAALARYLGVDVATVRREARTGRIPVIRLGEGSKARMRFDLEAVKAKLTA